MVFMIACLEDANRTTYKKCRAQFTKLPVTKYILAWVKGAAQ